MGWGVPDSSWQEILPGLAAKTRVCLFDRPGYGDSDPGPMPRDTMASVRHSLGNLPLIILQAAASPDDERSLELAAMAQDSSRGTHRIIANSRHYIYRDQPDIVIKAFGDIVDAARGDDPAHELVLP
jgi:pimeloyl-ACP methyl ester carboxylesterase